MTGCGREKDIQRGNDAGLIEHLIEPTLLRRNLAQAFAAPPKRAGASVGRPRYTPWCGRERRRCALRPDIKKPQGVNPAAESQETRAYFLRFRPAAAQESTPKPRRAPVEPLSGTGFGA